MGVMELLKRYAPILLIISLVVFSLFITNINVNASIASNNNPVNLKIYLGPANILADNKSYNCIFVQLQDSTGNPARALQDTTVGLSSSSTNIGTVDSSIIILKGTTYSSASFHTTFSPGASVISASATGFASVQTSINTVGPIPYSVAAYGFPSTLPADGGSHDAIMVQLQDSSGIPAIAPKGGVVVSLACSNATLGSVSPSITIPEGQTYAIATFNTTTVAQAEGRIKTVVITTVAQGYTSQQVTITITPLATNPDRLKIYPGPNKIPADQSMYPQIAIQAQNASGFAATYTSDVLVSLGSSDPSIGKIDSQIIIPLNQTYAVATINSTFKAGTTTITAVATDLQRSQQSIITTGFTPSKIAVYCTPPLLPSDKTVYQSIQVQLQDSQGRPAKDPQADVYLSLFSSQPTVGTVTQLLTIPFGETQATGGITVTNSPGSTTITAQASSYTTGQGAVTTYIVDFLPFDISVTANYTTVNNGQKTDIVASVMVDNNPIPGATLRFTSDNGGTFTTTIDQGNGLYKTTYTAPSFTRSTTCTITVTASKTGFVTSQTTVQVTVEPPTPSPTPTQVPTATPQPVVTPKPTLTPNPTTATVQICVADTDGAPLSNASIFSTNQPAGATSLSGVTNATGFVTFTNVTVGKYALNITKDGYFETNKTLTFSGQPVKLTYGLASATSPDAGNGDSWTLPIIIISIIIILAIACLAIKRRRRSDTKSSSKSSSFKLSHYPSNWR